MEVRSLRGHGGHGAQNSSKMKKYLAEKQKMAQTPCFPRQSLRTSASPSSPTISLLESIDHIRIGAYYEIDHSKLPPRNTPEHFKSVRVVMVSEKGPLKVSVRFPSIQSLRNHVVEKGYQTKLIPALTEKYTMPPEMASEVLYRRIPPQEIADKGNVWSFWAVRPPPEANYRLSSWSSQVGSKKGPCWSELKFTGMVKWGKRRKVCYLRRHESPPSSGDEAEKGKEIMELEEFGNCVYVDDDDEKTEDDEDDVKTEDDEEEAPPPPSPPKKVNLRKRQLPARKVKVTPQKKKSKAKGAKRQKQNQIVAVPKQNTKQLVKVTKNTISRWSAERYKLAEENMLKVMKDKNATVENPMLRPALRIEARKLIGDTGLLDHLLKHMAGKVAPGGDERFRRRHNADGAMEYWLESADLVDIRKESGVEDPFWIPPPGWKLGDNPTQDPTCARQINELKEEIVQLRREMQETKQNKGDLTMVTTSSPCVTCLDWDQSSLTQLQDLYAELSVKKAKLEENLMEASHNLSGMEALQERIGMLKCMEDPPPLSDVTDQREATNINLRQKNKAVAATSTKDKAAKIERLRSGFTIFRPQESFLWPDMSISPSQIVVPQVQNDCFVVATPPSAASSSAAHNRLIIQPIAQLPPQPTHGPKPSSAVKPLAERRPVDSITLCNVTTKPSSSSPPGFPKSSKTSITIPTQSLILNLNDLPNPNPDPQNSCDTTTAFSRPITYHRRHSQQNVVKPKKEMEDGNGARKESPESMLENDQQIRCSASPSTTASKWMGEKWWLAMGTPSPTSLDNSHRG